MRPLLPALLCAALATPALACDGGKLFAMIDAPLPEKPDLTFDVAEVDSAEGGSWDVYFASGTRRAERLVRTDFGEGGRFSARLLVSAPDAYAVTTTLSLYSAPVGVERSMTVWEEKNIFVFCDGELYLPAGDFGLGDDYPNAAKEALDTFGAAEVQAYLPELKR